MNGLRDQDKLDGASNFVIWKARILAVLDKNHIKDYALKIVVVLVDVDPLKKYKDAQAKVKCMILDGVKDHVITNIVEKETTREMWEALTTLYEGTFIQQKMLLENQLREYHMQKGEEIDPFLLKLQVIRDQLTSMGSTPDPEFMVRTALMQSLKTGSPLYRAFWAGLLFPVGRRYGQLLT